jgi:hypothetical protein
MLTPEFRSQDNQSELIESQRQAIALEVKETLRARPIELMDTSRVVTLEQLGLDKDSREVILCDCYLENAELGTVTAYGLELPRVTNLDHHSPLLQFAKAISSGNLALKFVESHGAANPQDTRIIINHTDADSIISSGIVSGNLPADPKYGIAVLAADHTGEKNPIADLGQALQKKRDVEFSLRNLKYLEANLPLDAEAEKMLAKRMRERQEAIELVASGGFVISGRVAVGNTPTKVDTSLYPSLIPNAELIVVGNPHGENNELWSNSLRLGLNAPDGLTIHDLNINDFDPNYGGRWNAGSTKRGGGSKFSPQEMADRINQKLDLWHEQHDI